jgi:hypothetical protein
MQWVYGPDPYRNILVDGGFEVWQGSRSYTLPGTDQRCQGPDMWQEAVTASPGNYTISRQAGLAPGSRYCLRWQRTAGTVTNNLCVLGHNSETALCINAAGKKLTVSFRVRGGANFTGLAAPTFPAGKNLRLGISTGTGTDETTIAGAGLTGSTDFDAYFNVGQGVVQRFQHTINVPSNCTQIMVAFLWWHGTTVSGANDYIEFDDVQIETNDIATPFERVPFDQTYIRVQRYRQKSFDYDTAPAQNAGANGAHTYGLCVGGAVLSTGGPIRFAPTMRALPGITLYNPQALNAFARNVSLGTDATATAASNPGAAASGVIQTGLAAWAAGNQIAVHWVADSRL